MFVESRTEMDVGVKKDLFKCPIKFILLQIIAIDDYVLR
jgi:hypothetical protein